MLYCNACGQCTHITDDYFIEIRNTSGWERVTIDPENGETYDYTDSEVTDSDHENYECPNCSSEDIEFDSSVSAEEAEAQREQHDDHRRTFSAEQAERRKREAEEKIAKDPNREWDVVSNV